MLESTWQKLLFCAVVVGVSARSQATEKTNTSQTATVEQTLGGSNEQPEKQWKRKSRAAPPQGKGHPKANAPTTIAGEVIVKFKASGPQAVTECVRSWLDQGRSFQTATADSSDSLDHAMRQHRVRSAQPLMPDRQGLSTEDARRQVRRRGAKGHRGGRQLAEELVNVYRLNIPTHANVEKVAQQLSRDPHIEYAHPNYEMRSTYLPNDPYLATRGSWGQAAEDLWGLVNIGAFRAWDSARGAGVVVAVVDSGVDLTHPDIVDNIWTNLDEVSGNGVDDDGNGYVDDLHGWNTYANSSDPSDRWGHGTHVAGTIAAQDDNAEGIAGVAPDAQIMAVKGLNDYGGGSVFSLSQGLLYAAENGADVINNSWGCAGGCPPVPVLEEAVSTAYEMGSVVVFSAGNDQLDIRGYSPINRHPPIVVSAVDPNNLLASFSNFGFVDVAAPGAGDESEAAVERPMRGILSLKAAFCNTSAACPPELVVGDNYLRQAGTSMAAPHVSGLAALILSQHPDYSVEQVRQVIRRSSQDIGDLGFDTKFGYGLIDAAAAMAEAVPLESLLIAPIRIETLEDLAIEGSATGPEFASYTLDYALNEPGATWTTIAMSSKPVISDVLASWSVGKVSDGEYVLRLTARASDGRAYEDRAPVTLDRTVITSPKAVTYNGHNNASFEIVGTTAPAGMRSYRLFLENMLDGTALDGDFSLTNGGTVPILDGVLGTLDPTGLPADHYRIMLEVTLDDGRIVMDSVPVVIDTKLHEGWPVVLDNFDLSNSYPVAEHSILADLDGDGRDEQIVAFGLGVNAFIHDGTQLPGWPQVIPETDVFDFLWDAPAVGDIDDDGEPEVVICTYGGQLLAWNADGSLLSGWPLSRASNVKHDVSLADVNGDGRLEVVFTDGAGELDVLHGDGTSHHGFPVATGFSITGGATAADLDKDGDVELMAVSSGAGASEIFGFDHTGQPLPGFPQTIISSSSWGSFPVVGDLDDDGDLEIVTAAATYNDRGIIAAYHHNGETVAGWPQVHIGAFNVAPPVLADLTGNGSLEVMAGVSKDGYGAIFVYRNNGELIPGWPARTPEGTIVFTSTPFFSPMVLDSNGDGRSEFVSARLQDDLLTEPVMPYGRTLQAFQFDATPVPELVRPTYGNLQWGAFDSSPAVGDMDGDGLLEMVWIERRDPFAVETLSHVWDLDIPVSAKQSWPMYRSNPQHSAVAETVVPIVELTEADRDQTLRVDRLARYRITTGEAGIIQIGHPWQADVKIGLDDGLFVSPPHDWGGPIQAEPFTECLVRVLVPSEMDIRLSWW